MESFQDDREKIEIFLSCRSLTSSSIGNNYQIRISTKSASGIWTEYAKTEIIPDNWNPNFVKTFIIEYIFEVQQHLKLELLTTDNSRSSLLAEAETNIGAIVGAKSQTLVLDFKNKGGEFFGKLILRCDKAQNSSESVFMKLRARNVANQRFFLFNSSPFLRFYRIKEGNSAPLLVHQTEPVKHSLNPVWAPIDINLGKLCNGDHLLPIKVEIWDNRSSGQHSYIGELSFTIKEINEKKKEFIFKNPKKNKNNQGILLFDSVAINFVPQFIDFVRGGTQLALVIAVDFTSSNGYPHRNDSLHTYNPVGGMNAYQKAISACGDILLNYDYDKLVPIYGFGGRPKFPQLNTQQTMHCFPLNGKVEDPYCFSLEGIMGAYNYALHNVELNGPTLFCPIITEVMKICQESKRNGDDQYYILMILTDGEIHDMEQTIKAIVDCSHLPLSIIIIGIGNADFTNMDILDGDEGLWDSNGRKAQRDLVQFVPFNKFAGDSTALAAHVLEELPLQLTEYMRLVGKKPKPPQQNVSMNINLQRENSSGAKPMLGLRNNEGNEKKFIENNPPPIAQQKFAGQMANAGFLNNFMGGAGKPEFGVPYNNPAPGGLYQSGDYNNNNNQGGYNFRK